MTRQKNNIWKKENSSVSVTCTMRNRGNFSYYDFFLLTTIRRRKISVLLIEYSYFCSLVGGDLKGGGGVNFRPEGGKSFAKRNIKTQVQWTHFFPELKLKMVFSRSFRAGYEKKLENQVIFYKYCNLPFHSLLPWHANISNIS